jgi:pyruvate formate lyase activating enzyme
MRQDYAIVLTICGRSSGYCVDPVEKKPLNHFLPGSAGLSFGTAWCNLGCRFCQNWDISKSRETDTLADAAAPPAIARAAADSDAAASRSPTTTRSSSWSTPSTWPTHATRRASRRWR